MTRSFKLKGSETKIISQIISAFVGITDLGTIQFALSLQCVPVFLFGLYGK
jgi:hypothetical protein